MNSFVGVIYMYSWLSRWDLLSRRERQRWRAEESLSWHLACCLPVHPRGVWTANLSSTSGFHCQSQWFSATIERRKSRVHDWQCHLWNFENEHEQIFGRPQLGYLLCCYYTCEASTIKSNTFRSAVQPWQESTSLHSIDIVPLFQHLLQNCSTIFQDQLE